MQLCSQNATATTTPTHVSLMNLFMRCRVALVVECASTALITHKVCAAKAVLHFTTPNLHWHLPILISAYVSQFMLNFVKYLCYNYYMMYRSTLCTCTLWWALSYSLLCMNSVILYLWVAYVLCCLLAVFDCMLLTDTYIGMLWYCLLSSQHVTVICEV